MSAYKIIQMVILVVGAITFAVVMWNPPWMIGYKSSYDYVAAFARGLSVLVITAALYFVVGQLRKR